MHTVANIANAAATDPPELQALQRERDELAQSGRVHKVHWLVVGMSLLLTLSAWYVTGHQIDQKVDDRFRAETDRVIDLITHRMENYEDGLNGGIAAVQAAGGVMDVNQWRTFANSLHIEEKYPGINGIGIIHDVSPDQRAAYLAQQRRFRPDYRIHPPHARSEIFPITFVEPVGMNAKAVGLDVAHEKNRYESFKRARASGKPTITGPIVLVQDAQRTPGFLFYAPFYARDNLTTEDARLAHFSGAVYAPFVFHKLIEGILGPDNRQVRFSVMDGADVIYDERNPEQDQGRHKRTVVLPIYGQEWTFQFWDTPDFQEQMSSNEPLMILIGGLIIDSLLLYVFVILARSNRRSLAFADGMTARLIQKAESLERSNEELEKFAYVTSHDLKTPLRGIGYLLGYLQDDLKEEIAPDSRGAAVVDQHLDRLFGQLQRMENLIAGILAYSSMRDTAGRLGNIATDALIREVCDQFDLRADQVELRGRFPVIYGNATRLEQVFSNLVSNACKYHPDQNEIHLVFEAAQTDDHVTFSVCDNGPGIDARYHQKIFDVFQTLGASSEIDSTGIGLSIVRRAVETEGGTIRVDSAPGQGCKMIFDWPLDCRSSTNLQRAA